MQTKAPRNSSRKTEKELSHYATDSLGISLIAIAIIMVFGLAMGQAGILGEAISKFLLILFGRGAWIAPVLFTFMGLTLLTGKQKVAFGRLAFGLSLIFFAIIGGFAKEIKGDYFDPEIVITSGGYLGALFGSFFNLLIGSAKPVGFLAMACIGFAVSLNGPVRSIIQSFIEKLYQAKEKPKKPKLIERKPVQKPTFQETKIEEEKEPKKNILTALIPEPKPKAKAKPLMKDSRFSEIKLSGEESESKDKEGYALPALTLLNEPQAPPKRTPKEMEDNIKTLEDTLEEFRIEANVVEVATGPTITRYEINLGRGIRVSRITALADNIAMRLAASHVRVEAPIPGKSAIGVEVPNSKPSVVTLRQLCDQAEFLENPSRLFVALGQDVSGVNKYADLTRMPHLLIGGATNSGKSIGLATIITSLLLRNTPKDLKMVMIDPKRVELSLFDDIPHLMCPVVKDVKEAPGVLRAVWKEMDERYDLFSEAGVRNIDGWNAKASFQDKMSYIVVIIDELADPMIQAAAEVETSICRLAQLARATGIHLVIATQRPSVDVITGTIKANIPSRIAFSVSSPIDSRTILDRKGADSLIGRGDMLYAPIDASKPTRIQGCYVSEKEIEQICEHWKEQESPNYVLNPVDVVIADAEAKVAEQETDPMYESCVRYVVERGQASTSMIQTKFSIGFQRASRLMTSMEMRGVIGPKDGSRPRDVLIDPIEVDNLFGRTQFTSTGPVA